ncbi:sugar transferase [Chitinophaga sp. CF418]|uniref:sugar transferase n=1 Tax=Chitinophaga sp. CF418 TaxID=1855287 RepID=UPI000923ABC8|nr:sugar transferase [Chitinophaga sp. CF418]SHN36330.1 Sugar transferase involved in LPS biosynthesis (colanic, teichoic acid) [Chitinophaga sp. CF418]
MKNIELFALLATVSIGCGLLSSLVRLKKGIHRKKRENLPAIWVIERSTGIRYILNNLLSRFAQIYTFDRYEKAISYIRKGIVPDIIIVTGDSTASVFSDLQNVKDNSIILLLPDRLERPLPDEYSRKLARCFLIPFDPIELRNVVSYLLMQSANEYRVDRNKYKLVIQSPLPGESFFWRRTFDILFSTLLIFLVAPVFVLIAIIIKLESKGPVFYVANRAGQGYNIFKFFKFRTMVQQADKMMEQLKYMNQYSNEGSGPVFFKISNDPRVTKFGAFLRNTGLDELPQLFNILKGDMSFIGNRPLPLYEASSLTSEWGADRFMAPAGMTGIWGVLKKGEKEELSTKQRITIETNYARKRSWSYNWSIIRGAIFASVRRKLVERVSMGFFPTDAEH